MFTVSTPLSTLMAKKPNLSSSSFRSDSHFRDQLRRLGMHVQGRSLPLEHVPPICLVGDMLLEHHLHSSGLQASPNTNNRQRLCRPLINPARRHLGTTGYPYLQTR